MRQSPDPAVAQRTALLRRLRRIEGQVRGVAGMVDGERDCEDILIQLAAIRAALDAVALAMLREQARCWALAVLPQGEGQRVADELTRLVTRLTR